MCSQNDQVSVDTVTLKYTTLVLVTYNSSKGNMSYHICINNIYKIFQVCRSISMPQKLKIIDNLLSSPLIPHYSAGCPVSVSNGKSSKHVFVLHHRAGKVVDLVDIVIMGQTCFVL